MAVSPEFPIPEIEPYPFDKDRGELRLDPSLEAAAQIEADAARRGRQDLIGFQIQGGDRRYEVIDSGVKVEHRADIKSTGRPKIEKSGRVYGVYRRTKSVNETLSDVPVVTMAEYEAETGDLVRVTKLDRRSFLAMTNSVGDLADPGARVTASWKPEDERLSDHDELPITLTGKNSRGEKASTFDELTELLEANNAPNWTGLTWQRGSVTQQIIEDAAIKRPSDNGKGYVWNRTFIVKTTDAHGKVLDVQSMQDFKFADYLKKINQDQSNRNSRPMTNVRMYRTEAEINLEKKRLSPPPPDPKLEAIKAKLDEAQTQQLLEVIATETASFEGVISDEDRVIAWLLSYSEILPPEVAEERMFDIAAEEVSKGHKKTSVIAKRKEVLKEAMNQYGLIPIVELALKMQQDYETSMHKLQQPVSAPSQSISWFIEPMADRLYYADHPRETRLASPRLDKLELGDAFGYNAASFKLQRDIVDQRVAEGFVAIADVEHGREAFEKALIQRIHQAGPTGELDAENQPAYGVKTIFNFNEDRFSSLDQYPRTKPMKAAWARRNAFEKEMLRMGKQFYDQIMKDEIITQKQLVDYGRLLRRSVGH